MIFDYYTSFNCIVINPGTPHPFNYSQFTAEYCLRFEKVIRCAIFCLCICVFQTYVTSVVQDI